jgi:hypothetical protein
MHHASKSFNGVRVTVVGLGVEHDLKIGVISEVPQPGAYTYKSTLDSSTKDWSGTRITDGPKDIGNI